MGNHIGYIVSWFVTMRTAVWPAAKTYEIKTVYFVKL